MSIGEDLRTWLTSVATTATGVHQNHIPQGKQTPVVWFGRATTVNEDALDDQDEGPFEHVFDVEAISDDIDEALDLADLIHAKHPQPRTTIGTGTVQGIMIEDQRDDYIPRGISSDDGFHVASLQLRTFGYEPGA